jgi:hypothetical protein
MNLVCAWWTAGQCVAQAMKDRRAAHLKYHAA